MRRRSTFRELSLEYPVLEGFRLNYPSTGTVVFLHVIINPYHLVEALDFEISKYTCFLIVKLNHNRAGLLCLIIYLYISW